MRCLSSLPLLLVLLVAGCAGSTSPPPTTPTSPPMATAVPAPTVAVTLTVPSRPTATAPPFAQAAASPLAGAPPPGASPTPLAGSRTITPADQGQTLRLAVGETFTLQLGSGADWDIQITDPRVVAPVQAATPGPGAQGIYQARSAGVSELLAVATPACAKAQPPCRVLAPAFRLLIVVR